MMGDIIADSRATSPGIRSEVRLTKNLGGICQLSGMELQLGRDTTKDDDYRTRVCTVTAIK